MNDENVKQGIDAITSQSPVTQQIKAINNMRFPSEEDGQSTLVTGDIEGKVADQIVSTPEQGVEFNPDTTEVYRGGVASPKATYNTRRQTLDDKGNPLYFEPNYQAVAPYDFDTMFGKVKANTVDANKLKWQIGKAQGVFDDKDFMGYLPIPDVGRLSMWSHAVGDTKGFLVSAPDMLAQGAVNVTGEIGKAGTWLLSPAINTTIDFINKNPDAIVSDVLKGVMFEGSPDHPTGIIMNDLNNMMNLMDNAVDPEEKMIMQAFAADLEDQSLRAQVARGFGDGVGALLLAPANKELVFTLLNFANANQMRQNALNAGVSPLFAELYGAVGPTATTALDIFQFDLYFKGAALSAHAGLEALKNLNRSNLYKFGQILLRRSGDALIEAGTEMAQEYIEGMYDPEFLEDPTDRLAVAGLSAIGLTMATMPVAVINARGKERAELAKAYGVYDQYLTVRKKTVDLVDSWEKAGRINASMKNEIVDMILTEAPQQVIRDIREGVKGQLDKIPVEERVEFANTLANVNPENFAIQEFAKLDNNIETALSGVRVSDDTKTMVKGVMRGAASVIALATGAKPSEIKVPTFKLVSGDSYYDAKTNTIGISKDFSNTQFTKTRENAQSGTTEDYNQYISNGAMVSTQQSDRLSTVLHELAHWLDYQVGEKGFGDFFQNYYNNISRAFGAENAQKVRSATNNFTTNRFGTEGGEYTATDNATEWNAQAISRIGKRSAEYFGLGKSKAARFLTYANVMFNQMPQFTGLVGYNQGKTIGNIQQAIRNVTKNNRDTIDNMIEVFGNDKIKQAIKDFNNGEYRNYADLSEYLADKNMLRDLYEVMDSFADATTSRKIKDLFDNKSEMENFVTAGDYYFNTGFDNEVENVRQRRAQAKEKKAQESGAAKKPVQANNNVQQVTLSSGKTVSVYPQGMPNLGKSKQTSGNDAIGSDDLNKTKDRFWSNAKYRMDGSIKISEQSKEVQEAAVKLAKKHFVDSDGFMMPNEILEIYGVNDPTDVKQLTGDEFVNVLNILNSYDTSLTKRTLGNYSINYWGDMLNSDLEYDALPNNYIIDSDPVEEIQQSFERGKQETEDDIPSYDVEVDGRKVGEDISILTQGIFARAKKLPNKIVKWFASSGWGWGLDRIVTTMFGRDASNKLDIAGKYSLRNTMRTQMFEQFLNNLSPIIGDIKTNKNQALFKYKTMLNQLGFVRVKDVEMNNPVVSDLTFKQDLTGWEVMYVYLMKRMGDKYANRIQQSTKANINDLIATLTDEEKQFADTMSNTLREVWIKRVGEENAVFNYFPILDAEHEFFDETSVDNFRARMDTDSAITITDAGRLFSKEISRLSSWDSGYYRTLKRLREVLQYKGAEGRNINPDTDNELKKASGILAGQVKDIFGRDGYHNLLRLIDNQIADPQEQMLDSASSQTLNQMGMNVIKSMLSFKFMSLPKNMVNITMMWGGAKDQALYWNRFSEGIANMKRTWEYMMAHSAEIRQRYNNIGYNEFLDQRSTGGNTAPVFKGISKLFANMNWGSDKTGGMAKMSAALDMMGDTGLKMFMLSGDAVANVYGGYGLIKDYMAQGMTEEEAFKKLDRYIIEHQSSSNMAMKPLKQLEANKSLAGQLMAFTSEGVVKWASILGTFDEVKMGTATKSEAIANAMSIAMSMVLFAFLSAGVYDLWDDDEKVREEAQDALTASMIDQMFGGLVVGNGFLTPMIQNLVGVGGQGGMSAPLWSFATDGINNLKRGEYDRLVTKALESSGLLIGANAVYNDVQGFMLLNSPEPEIREAGFRMMLGRTPSYAEKRTGAKLKETVEKNDEE